MGEETLVHVLLVSFPGQGHVNPLLRLAKRLASEGFLVTFCTTESLSQKLLKSTQNPTEATPIGKGHLRFEFFSDGWDLTDLRRTDMEIYMPQIKSAGPKSLSGIISRLAEEGRPVSCLVNNPFLPWVLDVAEDLGIQSAMLWVQSAAVFAAYYHYFNNTTTFPSSDTPDVSVHLPGLPLLQADEIPSFLHPANPYHCLNRVMTEQFENASKASWVFVDSFEELERPILDSISTVSPYRLTPVGPLLKSIESVDNKKVTGDLWEVADCLEWLDGQKTSSVVYVSFGSVVVLPREQMEEIALGLRNSGKPFLWVVKPPQGSTEMLLPEWFLEETSGIGMVVQWCPQERVLLHPSVACFLTHCGWNSSMESLSCGVPVIGFPQWGDQVTNAKFLADVFGVGVRLRKDGGDGNLVTEKEVVRCIDEVTGGGGKAVEIKKNALKWKEESRKAVLEGGSSDRNIQAFVDDIKRRRKASPNIVRTNKAGGLPEVDAGQANPMVSANGSL